MKFLKNKQLFENVKNIERQIVDRKKIDSLIGEKFIKELLYIQINYQKSNFRYQK